MIFDVSSKMFLPLYVSDYLYQETRIQGRGAKKGEPYIPRDVIKRIGKSRLEFLVIPFKIRGQTFKPYGNFLNILGNVRKHTVTFYALYKNQKTTGRSNVKKHTPKVVKMFSEIF